MRTIQKKIDVVPNSMPAVINVNQYDSDFSIQFILYSSNGSLTIPTGTTASIRGTKADGNGYSANATSISGSTVVIAGDQQMTAAAGRNEFELVLECNNKELSTANFILQVERAAMDAGTITSDSVLRELNAIIAGAATATQAAEEADDAADRAEEAARTLTIDDTLTQTGQAADAKKVGDEIADLKDDLSDLEAEVEALEPGLSDAAKTALLACFAHVAWTDEHGQDYYDALESALIEITYPRLRVLYNPGSTIIYAMQRLNSLIPYLTVYYQASADSQEVELSSSEYTLEGLLNSASSTITVVYGDYSKSFTAIVDMNHYINGVNSDLGWGYMDDDRGLPTVHRSFAGLRVAAYTGSMRGYDGDTIVTYIKPMIVPDGIQKVSIAFPNSGNTYITAFLGFASDGETTTIDSSYVDPNTEVNVPSTTKYLFANIKRRDGSNPADSERSVSVTVTLS